MTAHSWTALKEASIRRLSETCPLAGEQAFAGRIAPAVTILALAEVDFDIRQIAGCVEARLTTDPIPLDDDLADGLLTEIVNVINAHVLQLGSRNSVDCNAWLNRHGFADLVIDLLAHGGGHADVSALAAVVAAAVGALTTRTIELGKAHRQAIAARDLPDVSISPHGLTQNARWLLAPEMSGNPKRSQFLKRRLQAFELYGALPTTLRMAAITAIVDEGSPLGPALMEELGLSAPELRALRQSHRIDHAIGEAVDFERAVEELKAHEVPLHEWPGKGLPGQPDAWERSCWVRRQRDHLIRPDYLDIDGTGVQDAWNALRDDLLRPLIAERLRIGGFSQRDFRLSTFARDLQLHAHGKDRNARRALLGALRRAIVGSRKPKAFHEAVDFWHRRAASLSALRHERQADKPGWPPLCTPWTSECGRYEIVALVSAADLVEEGNQLDHCVGGYYQTCRRGDIQILSLRDGGRRVATAEIGLGDNLLQPSLQVGQFKAHRNTTPGGHLHDVLRDFLRAVRSGIHPMNVDRLARYRKRMRDTYDASWHSDALPLDHPRQAFPLYLPLLPRGTPETFDDWCAQSALPAAFDAALRFIATQPSSPGKYPLPY